MFSLKLVTKYQKHPNYFERRSPIEDWYSAKIGRMVDDGNSIIALGVVTAPSDLPKDYKIF